MLAALRPFIYGCKFGCASKTCVNYGGRWLEMVENVCFLLVISLIGILLLAIRIKRRWVSRPVQVDRAYQIN